MIKQPLDRRLDSAEYVLFYVDKKGRRHEARTASLGASLRTYKVDDLDVVVKFSKRNYTTVFAGITLFPFANRLGNGEYFWDGIGYQIPINEPITNTNLHAGSQYYEFEILERSDSKITFALRFPAIAWYPFDIYTEVTYELSEKGLEVTTESINLGNTGAPWTLGFHPWFATRSKRSKCKLLVPARKYVEVNQRMLPIGENNVQGKFDLLTATLIGDNQYDHAFTDVVLSDEVDQAADAKVSVIELTGEDGHKTRVLADDNFTSWQICTRDDGRDDSDPIDGNKYYETVAIESMTAYADSFRTGKNLINLPPNTPFKSYWRIEFE